jgi:hypothetical protein
VRNNDRWKERWRVYWRRLVAPASKRVNGCHAGLDPAYIVAGAMTFRNSAAYPWECQIENGLIENGLICAISHPEDLKSGVS